MRCAMKPNWLSDARLIPDEVMSYFRKVGVNAIKENGVSPEEVAKTLGISRSSVYDWLNRFHQHGWDGLDTKKAPGSPPVITEEMDAWLRQTVLNASPEDFGYDTSLWTCDLLAQLLADRYEIHVVGATVNQHLHCLGLTNQKPLYVACEQDPEAVTQFVEEKFPKIQRLAKVIDADIGFEDEAAVDLREHSGKTWSPQGVRPKVHVTGKRGRLNILSVVTATGDFIYHVTEETIDSERYIEFLKQLIDGRTRPLILIVDRASFHRSRMTRTFICRHRHQIRLRYLPSYSPELNPDEHVWEEIKDKRLGRQPIKDKKDLRTRLHSALESLQHCAERVRSFFQLPETQYAAQ
jgi:transposase